MNKTVAKSKKIKKFYRCRTCGSFRTARDIIKGGYCSEECSLKYYRCYNCGKFFIIDEQNTVEISKKNKNLLYCSHICTKIYAFTKIKRS